MGCRVSDRVQVTDRQIVILKYIGIGRKRKSYGKKGNRSTDHALVVAERNGDHIQNRVYKNDDQNQHDAYVDDIKCFRTPAFAFPRFNAQFDLSFKLPQARIGYAPTDPVGYHDQDKSDDRHEQADCRCVFELLILDSFTIRVCADDISDRINFR